MPISRPGVRGSRSAHVLATAFTVFISCFALAGDADAKDRISLPFTCATDGARLRVEPAASDHEYPIVGAREQQSFTFCPIGEGGRCHTWMVHRFAVQCGGGRVPWMEVAAAASKHLPNRGVVESGQLLLRLGVRPVTVAGSRSHILALPRGFAPLGLIGGRVVLDADAPSRPVQPARFTASETPAAIPPIALPALPRRLPDTVVNEALAAPEMAKPEAKPAPATHPVEVTAVPAPVTAPPPAASADSPRLAPVATDSDAPQLEPIRFMQRAEAAGVSATRDEPATLSLDSFSRTYALMLVATALLTLTAVTVRRRRWRKARWQQVRNPGAVDGDGERAVALRDKAEGHITLIATALDRLAMMAPLRNALARDLQSSERRLAVVIAAISARNGVDAEAWTRARRRLERISQDLDRLQNIAESAVVSLSGLGSVRALPRNKDEAYLALGVTSGVSDAILKRLVEALRISWHPDLAQGDADREARDVRIKEINVAWDLITGKRESE